MVHVGDDYFELVVGVHPGDQAALQHLRQAANRCFEGFETFWRVAVHTDQHISREAQAQFLSIEQGYLAGDVAVVFQLLDPSRARRG
ncbi:hypothetical protein D3C77_661750 [compost metagenome]